VRRTSVSDALGRTIRRAGVTGTAHGLRHWYATELVRAGVPLTTVQRLMRHESLATTQRYVAVADDAPARALALLPDVG
jgi:integrase/recombinase XerD